MRAYLKFAALATFGVVLASCAPTQEAIIPRAIPVAETVVPHLVAVDNGVKKALDENKKLSEKLKETQKITTAQKFQIDDVIKQAEKIRLEASANQLISEIDAANLVDQLHKIADRNIFLEDHEKELVKLLEEQESTLTSTKVKAGETLLKLLEKEKEADSLRVVSDTLSKSVQAQTKNIADLKKDLEKEKIKAASSGVYKNWILGIVGAFITWTILKNVLMIYFPLAKFRV